jgi:hypothetical protein
MRCRYLTARVQPTRDQSVAKMTDQIGQIRAKADIAAVSITAYGAWSP